MKDPALVSILEEVFNRQRNCFIRYVVESSQAEIRDDFDRKVQAFYEDWRFESTLHLRLLEDLLSEEEVIVAGSPYPIEFSQFNYLSPSYLLKHVIQKMGEHLEKLSEHARRLDGWPKAQEVVRRIVGREGKRLEEARKLDQERPKPPPRPAKIKGTSAARW